MSNRQLAVLADSWGNTTSQDGQGRRIFVSNFPPNATPRDFYAFFGPLENIEGFQRRGRIAFIQFKRPSYFSYALAKNGESFMGRSIIIEPFRAPRKPKRNKSPGNTIQEFEPRVRLRSRTRSRSRSRSRSLSSNDSSSGRANRYGDSSKTNKEPNEASAVQKPAQLGSTPVDFWQRPIEIFPNAANQQMPNQVPLSEVEGDLPREIRLTLELLLMQKTAKSLSLVQIQNLINYFESIKIAIQNDNCVSHSGTNSTLAHFQESRDIQQPEQQQSQGPSSHFNQSEFDAQMEAPNNHELQDSQEKMEEQLDEDSQKPSLENVNYTVELLKTIFSS